MPNADIYTKLSELTGENYAEIERTLGIGNGAIGKALKRKSTVKPATLAKIAKWYPQHVAGLGVEIDNPAPESSAPGLVPDPQVPGIYQRIVEELIESSKAQREISKALLEERQLIRGTAHEAIGVAQEVKKLNEKLATAYAAQQKFEALLPKFEALQDVVLHQFEKPEKTSFQELTARVHIASQKFAQQQKTSTLTGVNS